MKALVLNDSTNLYSQSSYPLSVWMLSYLSVKLASSMGNSSKRSGRLCFRSSFGEVSPSSSWIFLLNTSCLSSSCDFLEAGEAIVLALILFGVAGDDEDGSYRVKDFVDNGDGLVFMVVMLAI